MCRKDYQTRKLNKPIYMGMSLLNDFEIHMYSFTMMFLNPNMKIIFCQNILCWFLQILTALC